MLMMLISFPCSPKGLSVRQGNVSLCYSRFTYFSSFSLFLFYEAFIKIYTLACESFKTPTTAPVALLKLMWAVVVCGCGVGVAVCFVHSWFGTVFCLFVKIHFVVFCLATL